MKTKIITRLSLISFLTAFFWVGSVVAIDNEKQNKELLRENQEERSWSGKKIQRETDLWKKELENWEKLAHEWERKRDNMHEKYYGDDFSGIDGREHCSESRCWGEDLSQFIFTDTQSGEKWELRKYSNDADVVFPNGDVIKNVNGGQVIVYKKPSDDAWESSNFGQVITYTNHTGDLWENENFGQIVTYKATDGSSWKSTNDGQIVEHKNTEGEVWKGSDNDDIDDMKFMRDMELMRDKM